MAFQIRWTKNALEDYKQIVEFLQEEWSQSIAEKFIELVNKRVETLSQLPLIGIISVKENSIRSISLTKHNRLYYRVSSELIEILDIFDTRQNPEKNIYE